MHFFTRRALRMSAIAAIGVAAALLLTGASAAQDQPKLPDGLYAEITTPRGVIVAKLYMDLTPMTVANFVGLAEGTIANAAFDLGTPFFDGSSFQRVEPGHVIQGGIPHSDRARGPGYQFPNEIHVGLSHNHIGAMNMANGGPNTNGSQFCFMLGDRSYLDGDYTVFGDAVQGLDVIQKIQRGDAIENVRILRIGAAAQAFHPTTESFQAMVKAAEQREAENQVKKAADEKEWIAKNYPKATGPEGGVLTQELRQQKKKAAPESGTASGAAALRVSYRGTEIRYVGGELGYSGPPLKATKFVSGENGVPGYFPSPVAFDYVPGKTRLNRGLDAVLATMKPGERRIVIVPPAEGYGRNGLYPPEVKGKPRFVISPEVLLVYDVEVLAGQ